MNNLKLLPLLFFFILLITNASYAADPMDEIIKNVCINQGEVQFYNDKEWSEWQKRIPGRDSLEYHHSGFYYSFPVVLGGVGCVKITPTSCEAARVTFAPVMADTMVTIKLSDTYANLITSPGTCNDPFVKSVCTLCQRTGNK